MRVGQDKSKVTPNPQDGVSEWQVALFTLMSRDFQRHWTFGREDEVGGHQVLIYLDRQFETLPCGCSVPWRTLL